MALHLCRAPTKAELMRLRDIEGSLPWFKAEHHWGQMGRNLLMKQNESTHDIGAETCKTTNYIPDSNLAKLN